MRHKTLLQHLLFWVTFLLLWTAHDLAYHNDFGDLLRGNVNTIWAYVPLVYLNLLILVPRYLLPRKYAAYLLTLGVAVVGVTLFTSWRSYHYYYESRALSSTAEFFWSIEGRITILTEILVLLGLTMTLYLLQEWYQKERYARDMEQKRLEAELSLLKSQINPHFLFNSLNSIYVMIGKNVTAGREMLMRFSDILSHQLYEANKEQVSLHKEIDNLQNYIQIENIRHSDLAKVNVHCDGRINGQQIAPMLLLPLVENAFKHGQSSQGYWIDVNLTVTDDNELTFSVKNSVTARENTNTGGIGLTNVRRRLQLLYPGDHVFQTELADGVFIVDLKLSLHEN